MHQIIFSFKKKIDLKMSVFRRFTDSHFELNWQHQTIEREAITARGGRWCYHLTNVNQNEIQECVTHQSGCCSLSIT